MTGPSGERAIVLFSGGQDSTVCLALALTRYAHVETVGFDYGQRHRTELEARQAVFKALSTEFPELAARRSDDHMIDLSALGAISQTSLTRETEIRMSESGLPSTFVPGRNLLFFTYAAAVGYRHGIMRLIGGMCETDYSGYPDCRNETLKSLERSIQLGMDAPFRIETPLMWRDKAETWAVTYALGGDRLVALVAEHSHSCYLGNRDIRHDWGYGCKKCPACQLRAAGYRKWREGR